MKNNTDNISAIRFNLPARFLVSVIAIIVPVLLLIKGIYGSFIFTFSIPLVWEVGFRGLPIVSSLGVELKSIRASIVTGAVTGCILAFVGGTLLKFFGIAGYLFTEAHKLQLSFGIFNVAFPLQKEAGYRLMTMSNVALGTSLFALFCVFVIGVGEEIFWRGFIQKKITECFPGHLAVWVTALLFAAIHFYIFTILPVKTGVSFLALILFAGVTWGYLARYFGNIWSCAVSHGIVAFVIWKYYFFK